MSLRGVDRFREYTRKHKEVTAFIIALICTALVFLMIFTPPSSIIICILFIAAAVIFVFLVFFKFVDLLLSKFWWKEYEYGLQENQKNIHGRTR